MRYQTTGSFIRTCNLVVLILVFFGSVCFSQGKIEDISFFEKREKILKEQELEIERRKKELILLQKRIEEELKKISQLKEIIKRQLEEIKKMETERYMELANLYASIPPKRAGKIMENLDPKIAAKIMLYMDKKKAGLIWGFMDPKKACQITKEMVKLR